MYEREFCEECSSERANEWLQRENLFENDNIKTTRINNNSSKQHLIYHPNTAITHHHIKIKTEKELYQSGWKKTEIL